MSDVARVAKISIENFHHLESELKHLIDLSNRIQLQYPANPLMKKLEEEVTRLHAAFFISSVPLADPSVAAILIDETVKENLQLAEKVSSHKDWVMSSSLVKGNE